jgi:hypothetical protein
LELYARKTSIFLRLLAERRNSASLTNPRVHV